MNQELREQIANICRKGNAGIAETKVVDALYQLVVESQIAELDDLKPNRLFDSNGFETNVVYQIDVEDRIIELQSQLSSIGGKTE